MEMLHIGWDGLEWEVIHSFIESCMERDFDAFGVNIIPEDVL
jgi:hypothetical protein